MSNPFECFNWELNLESVLELVPMHPRNKRNPCLQLDFETNSVGPSFLSLW